MSDDDSKSTESEEDIKWGEVKDEKPQSNGGGGRKRPLIPYEAGTHFTSSGRRADYQGSDHAVQRVSGTSLEGMDYKDVRNSTRRIVTNHPEYGRSSQGPAAHVRRKTPFWMFPAKHMDTLRAPKCKESSLEAQKKGKKKELKKEDIEWVQILQPQHYQGVDRSRAWALWAPNGGPLSIYLTAENRDQVLEEFPYFRMRSDHEYELVADAYCPSADDMLRAMNPELADVENPSLKSSDELYEIVKAKGGRYTDYTYMNVSLQNTSREYSNVLIGKNAVEFGHTFDPYFEMDPHLNERHCTAINAATKLVTDERGIPKYVFVASGQEGSETEEGETDGPQALYRNLTLDEPRLKPLIQDPETAIRRYRQTKYHSRFDFNPDPEVYRDLWGREFKHRQPEFGIISDTERMSEVLYLTGRQQVDEPLWGGDRGIVVSLLRALFRRRKAKELKEELPLAPNYTFGPSHSAVDLILEMPVEEEVNIGKNVSSSKRDGEAERAFDLAQLDQRNTESMVSAWWKGHTPAMAKRTRSDVLKIEDHNSFWSDFPKRHLNAFLSHQVRTRDLFNLAKEIPSPKDFWKLVEHMEAFKFDPTACHWGYSRKTDTGVVVPRVPDALIRRLIRDPDESGINFRGHDGKRVLTLYYESSEDVQKKVRDFWVHRTPEARQDEQWKGLLKKHGVDYLVMAYAFWCPVESLKDFSSGLLVTMYRQQPAKPVVQHIDGKIRRYIRENKLHLRKFINEDLEGVYLGPDSPLRPYVEAWYELSDNRVWAYVYYWNEMFSSLDGPGSMWALTVSQALQLNEEGFGLGYGTPGEQQERQERLVDIALKTKFFDNAKKIIRWFAVRKTAVKLMVEIDDGALEGDKTWVTLNELKLKIAGYLENGGLVPSFVRKYLWPHLQKASGGILNEDFPFDDYKGEDDVDWAYIRENLNVMAGNESIPTQVQAAEAAETGNFTPHEKRLEIAERNAGWMVGIQHGVFFDMVNNLERRKVEEEEMPIAA